jgi:L-threonylcarbamoyladenylate synthase
MLKMPSDQTRLLPLRDEAAQQEALNLLASDEIFVAPTDTVYGIFARPDSPLAIERIYLAKARPPDKAIPVLIGDLAHLEQVAQPPTPPVAAALMMRFWPGALTLVLSAQPHLPPILTAGQPTVAVRMPAHAALCALLRRSGPLAATSANRSGGPDTHTAAEVLAQLAGCLPLILSDELSGEGAVPRAHQSLPSTIVDVTGMVHGEEPQILRQGELGGPVQRFLARWATENVEGGATRGQEMG